MELDLKALKNEILLYRPGRAVPCDDERVVFPDKLVIGVDMNNSMDVYALRCFLYGKEKADKLKRADERQTSTENQQEFWITDYISLMETSRPNTEGAIRDLAEKVGCMVKIVNTVRVYEEPRYVEEIKNIKKITGRFPVCAILHNDYRTVFNQAINALEESGMNDYCVVPFGSGGDKLQWLHLLRKCLPEGDRVLAANDQKKICTKPRCKSLYEKTKKDLEEANQEKRSLQQKMKELLASPEGTNKALDKALDEALGNWKQRTKLQLESEIRAAEQKQKADTPQQM